MDKDHKNNCVPSTYKPVFHRVSQKKENKTFGFCFHHQLSGVICVQQKVNIGNKKMVALLTMTESKAMFRL